MWDFSAQALASCFFLTYPLVDWAKKRGRSLSGAGFIGTLAGLCTVRWMPQEPRPCAFFLVGALFVSVAISDKAEELLAHKDDQRIVIDEWVGYLASVALLPRTPILLMIAFVLFRAVDVWKPLGINRLSRLPGGWGVVMDDFIAGLLVNAILRLLPLS
jgi:phosphatidylglycerophosphatase A